MTLSRTLWTMRSDAGKEITAAIYDVLTGRELRVSRGDSDGREDLCVLGQARERAGALNWRASVVEAQEVRLWVVPIPCEIPCPPALIALGFWTGRHNDPKQAGG